MNWNRDKILIAGTNKDYSFTVQGGEQPNDSYQKLLNQPPSFYERF